AREVRHRVVTASAGRAGSVPVRRLDGRNGDRSPDGQWAKAPAFPSAAGGLVSTIDDVHAFARMMLSGGVAPDGTRLLSRASVEAMTTPQLADPAGVSPDGSLSWGFGVGVQVRRVGLTRPVGTYGWDGGLG